MGSLKEFPVIGLLTVSAETPVLNPLGVELDAIRRDITYPLLSVDTGHGIELNNASLNATVGTFTLVLIDTSDELWTEPSIKVNDRIRISTINSGTVYESNSTLTRPTQLIGTGKVLDVATQFAVDDRGRDYRVLTITGVDRVQDFANRTIEALVSQARDSIEPGAEPWPMRVYRIDAGLLDPFGQTTQLVYSL